jgi:hypothetical protein
MPTLKEVQKKVYDLLNHSTKAPIITDLRKWAAEAGLDTEVFITTSSQLLDRPVTATASPTNDRIEGIGTRFTKRSPGEWLAMMKDSEWVKAGMPGITSRSDQVEDTINGVDAIPRYPAMSKCTWLELKRDDRHPILIVMIKAFEKFNEIQGIQIT